MTKYEYLDSPAVMSLKGGPTCDLCNGKNHPYMIQYKLWKQNVENPRSFVCIKCIEKKLGRHLEEDDFIQRSLFQNKISELPINWGYFGFHFKIYCGLPADRT